MIALPMARFDLGSLFKSPAKSVTPQTEETDDELRREYITRLINSDCCAGEFGVQGLMSLYPKDF